MEQIIKEIIAEINPFDEFDADTDLLGEGILDSLTLMLFIEGLEQRMDINISENDITMENFYSVKTIIKLLSNGVSGHVL